MTYSSGDISRKEILDAATKIFIEKGYNGTRVQEIADAALVNKGMIFYYFENKEKLYHEVFTNVFMEMVPNQFNSFHMDIPIMEKLIKYMERIIDIAIGNPEKVTFLINEINLYPGRTLGLILNEGIVDYFALQKQCDQEAEKGIISKIDIREIMVVLTSVATFPVLGREMYSKIYGFNNSHDFLEFHRKRKDTLKKIIENLLLPR